MTDASGRPVDTDDDTARPSWPGSVSKPSAMMVGCRDLFRCNFFQGLTRQLSRNGHVHESKLSRVTRLGSGVLSCLQEVAKVAESLKTVQGRDIKNTPNIVSDWWRVER